MTAMPPTKLRSALLLRFGGIISAAISMILCRTPPACPLFGTIASLRFAAKALPFSAAKAPPYSSAKALPFSSAKALPFSSAKAFLFSAAKAFLFSAAKKQRFRTENHQPAALLAYAGAAALRAEYKCFLSAVLFDTAGQSCILIGALCLFAACKLSRLFVFQSSAKLCGSMGILPCAEGM